MDKYEVLDSHIGEGSYGKVEKARDKRDGSIVAIKRVKIVPLSSKRMRKDITVEECGIDQSVLREIKVMTEMDHENIIKLKDVFVEHDFVNIVMPLMRSDLRKLLEMKIRMSESQIKCIMHQILCGVTELHAGWFLHRDLAPGNIFINDEGICKIADFGLARSYGSPRPSQMTYEVVTLWYRAPELLYGAFYYHESIDVWSIGCIFAELLQGGKALFPGTSAVDQLIKIFTVCGTPAVSDKQGTEKESAGRWSAATSLPLFVEFSFTKPRKWSEVIPNASSLALDLLGMMLELDPLKRISCAQALKHPYFNTAPWKCLPSELPLERL